MKVTPMLSAPHLLPSLLRAVRENAGLSQEELAAKCGTSQSGVARWESGKRPIVETTLEKVADALSMSVEDLLTEGLKALRKQRKEAGHHGHEPDRTA